MKKRTWEQSRNSRTPYPPV